MKVRTSAPSNIALIKYMGKIDTKDNSPVNSSLSLTLDNLRTYVEIEKIDDQESDQEKESDIWQPLEEEAKTNLVLSDQGRIRFLKHFSNAKKKFGLKGRFIVRSANNFPSDCGLASSASSFAALTMATGELAKECGLEKPSAFDLAEVSRKGSGSSCRSFFGPWSLWSSSGVRPLELPLNKLLHAVVIVEANKKLVSSSEAHRRVITSPLFSGRPERAEARLAELLIAFRHQDWEQIYQICWSEFWDMHALFETSKPAFGYFEPGTIQVLKLVREIWEAEKDGPVATMDAGANVHLLFRQDQLALREKIKGLLSPQFGYFVS